MDIMQAGWAKIYSQGTNQSDLAAPGNYANIDSLIPTMVENIYCALLIFCENIVFEMSIHKTKQNGLGVKHEGKMEDFTEILSGTKCVGIHFFLVWTGGAYLPLAGGDTEVV